MRAHDCKDSMYSSIFLPSNGIRQLVLELHQSLAMMVKNLFGWLTNALLRDIAGLRLGDGSLEDTYIVDNELKVVISQMLDAGYVTEGSQYPLRNERLKDCVALEPLQPYEADSIR